MQRHPCIKRAKWRALLFLQLPRPGTGERTGGGWRIAVDQVLEEYRNHLQGERNLSPATVRNYVDDLSPFFEFLKNEDMGEEDPLKGLRGFLLRKGEDAVNQEYQAFHAQLRGMADEHTLHEPGQGQPGTRPCQNEHGQKPGKHPLLLPIPDFTWAYAFSAYMEQGLGGYARTDSQDAQTLASSPIPARGGFPDRTAPGLIQREPSQTSLAQGCRSPGTVVWLRSASFGGCRAQTCQT